MGPNKVYCKIFNNGETIEFHSSSIKEEVINKQALCKRIKADNADSQYIVDQWKEYIKGMQLIELDGDTHNEK